jgi:hypothetical protein
LEVRWLQVFGGSGSQERLAQICLETFQYDCVEKHYMAMSQTDTKHFLTLGADGRRLGLGYLEMTGYAGPLRL